MKILPINKGFLLIGITVVFVLLLVTFLPYEAANYDSQPSSSFETVLIKIFKFISFPTIYTLDNWSFASMNGIVYLIILLINIFIYGLLIERMLSFFVHRAKSK